MQFGKIALLLWIVGCGTGIDRVEGIKGEKGDPGVAGASGAPGIPGLNGKDGRDGRDTQAPYPPTAPVSTSIMIVINGQAPQCPSPQCPEPLTVICACVATKWKTIMVDKKDLPNYKIKNMGECQSKQQFKPLCGRVFTPQQQETPEC